MPNDADFVLVSNWRIAAPRERVWQALKHPPGWTRWWSFVRSVDELEPGDADGVGARYDFLWGSRLPYSIRLLTTVTGVRSHEFIQAQAEGDLRGTGTWRLRERDRNTFVEYTWSVRLDRGWMRAFLPMLRPVFAWNHDAVMAAGESGLSGFLADMPRTVAV